MAGDYNTTQKNLLLAGNDAQQCQRHAEYAYNATLRNPQQNVQLLTKLEKYGQQARLLADQLQQLLKEVDAGIYDNNKLPF